MTRRVFIGIEIPDKIKDEMGLVQRKIHGAKFKLVERENMHVTVSFLGSVDEEAFKTIKSINLSTFLPFALEIGGIQFFPSRNYVRVISFGAESPIIKDIQQKIRSETLKFGIDATMDSPHMTLARVKSVQNKEELLSVQEEQLKTKNFKVKRLVLFESTLTPEGPVYRQIKSWE